MALVGDKCTNAEPASPIYSYDVELPQNSIGTVRIPTPDVPTSALIIEGNTTIWNKGVFVPGVLGIFNATAGADSVTFSIGSGSYTFSVFNF